MFSRPVEENNPPPKCMSCSALIKEKKIKNWRILSLKAEAGSGSRSHSGVTFRGSDLDKAARMSVLPLFREKLMVFIAQLSLRTKQSDLHPSRAQLWEFTLRKFTSTFRSLSSPQLNRIQVHGGFLFIPSPSNFYH